MGQRTEGTKILGKCYAGIFLILIGKSENESVYSLGTLFNAEGRIKLKNNVNIAKYAKLNGKTKVTAQKSRKC